VNECKPLVLGLVGVMVYVVVEATKETKVRHTNTANTSPVPGLLRLNL